MFPSTLAPKHHIQNRKCPDQISICTIDTTDTHKRDILPLTLFTACYYTDTGFYLCLMGKTSCAACLNATRDGISVIYNFFCVDTAVRK